MEGIHITSLIFFLGSMSLYIPFLSMVIFHLQPEQPGLFSLHTEPWCGWLDSVPP